MAHVVPVLIVCILMAYAIEASSEQLGCGASSDTVCGHPSASAGLGLLQHGSAVHMARFADADEQEEPLTKAVDDKPIDIKWNPSQGRRMPLCHHRIVEQACRRLNGGPVGSTPSSISFALLQDQLSANDTVIASMLTTLGFDASHSDVNCRDLCSAIVQHVKEVGGHLPPSTDVACYSVEGSINCDADVDPFNLERMLASVKDDPIPDHGPQEAPDADAVNYNNPEGPHLVQFATSTAGDGVLRREARNRRITDVSGHDTATSGIQGKSWCSYTTWEAVERVAGIFRMYPTDGKEVSVSLPATALLQGSWAERAPTEVKARIAASNAQARAWVSTVVGEMEGKRTVEFRREWFGGAGWPSDSEVRTRVMLTMNFIDRILLEGIHYVYPADQARETSCGGSVVAYVWKWKTSEKGFAETQGPVCSESQSPFTKACGIDSTGRYFVYLCKRWFENSGLNSQISTLVHEAAHHAGPGDVTYDRDEMRDVAKSKQLDNAANYQYFAQDVAQTTWGCADDETVTGLPFTCTPSPCSCPAFSNLCDDARYGSEVRRQCPATCGDCNAPAGGASPEPSPGPAPTSPVPSPTPAPTPVASPTPAPAPPVRPAPKTPSTVAPVGTCSEEAGEREVRIGFQVYSGSCRAFFQAGMCSQGSVAEICPITCGVCVLPGCEDDPDFSISTSRGAFTCETWRRYNCWRKVEQFCPTSCKLDRCAR